MTFIARCVRRLLAMRVTSAALLCLLLYWFTSMVGTYRQPGHYLALGVLPGLALCTLALLMLVHRLCTATRPPWVQPILDHADRFALLLVVNLILVSLLAPFFRMLSLLPVGSRILEGALTAAGRVSGQLLFGLFIVGAVGLACVIVVCVFDHVVLRQARAPRLVGLLSAATRSAVIGYALYGLALAYNGSLDTSPAVEHRSEIVGVTALGFVWWADVESWQTPGRRERVLIFRERDDLILARTGPGQPVRVRVRGGFLGLPWVESLRLDEDRHLARLVDAAPSAALPRRRLVLALLRDRRWTEALQHAKAYLHFYPGDREFLTTVVTVLHGAGRFDDAAALEQPGQRRAGQS